MTRKTLYMIVTGDYSGNLFFPIRDGGEDEDGDALLFGQVMLVRGGGYIWKDLTVPLVYLEIYTTYEGDEE